LATSARGKNSCMPQGKFENFRFWNFNRNFLFLNFEKNWSYHWREMEKIENKFNFEIWKSLAIPPEGNEKNSIRIENLKWKNLKFLIFEIFKWKFLFEIWKNWPYHQRKWKNEIKRSYISFYATNIKLPIIPYTTYVYHMCKSWWYTINLSRQILSYWSFFNSDIGWYGPP
jgi:hypothetical protein